MVPDAALLERLRQQMSQVQQRHERDRQGAARAFWKSLTPPVGDSPEGGRPDELGGSDSASGSPAAGRQKRRTGRDGRGAGAGRHGGSAPAGGPGVGRGRRPGPRARASARPVGRGVWADVGPGGPLETYPSQVQQRHERDRQGAARAFWKSLTPPVGDSPEGGRPDELGGSD
ncbi:MAG: hypothetical protein ACTHJJ_16845, partial [Intrasporangium sp.]